MNGTFKQFLIKYHEYNRPSQTIEIEKQNIRNNLICPICPHIFGEIKYQYNMREYKLPELINNVKINYNRILDEYTLLILEK